MKLIEFKEQTIIIAEDQPEYLNLPAHQFTDAEGTLAFCWKMSWRERLKCLVTGKIWHKVLTFQTPLQPQLLMVDKPDMNSES